MELHDTFFTTVYTLLMRLWLKKFAIPPFEGVMRYFPYVKVPRTVKKHPAILVPVRDNSTDINRNQ